MSFDTVRGKVETSMAALAAGTWAASGSPVVAYDNVNFDARNQTTWARVMLEPGDSFNKSIESDFQIRHVGLVVVALYTRLRTGAAPLLGYADDVSDTFSNTRSGAVWFDQARIIRIGEIDEVYQVNVSIPYVYDEVSP